MYLLHLSIDNGLVPYRVDVRFDLPGEHSDDYARKMARAIADGYRDVYGARVRSVALAETDVTRDLQLADDPEAVEREKRLPQIRVRERREPPPPPE